MKKNSNVFSRVPYLNTPLHIDGIFTSENQKEVDAQLDIAIKAKLPWVVIKTLFSIKAQLQNKTNEAHVLYFHAQEKKRVDAPSVLRENILEYLDPACYLQNGYDLLQLIADRGTHVVTGVIYGSFILLHISISEMEFQKSKHVNGTFKAKTPDLPGSIGGNIGLRFKSSRKERMYLRSEFLVEICKGIDLDLKKIPISNDPNTLLEYIRSSVHKALKKRTKSVEIGHICTPISKIADRALPQSSGIKIHWNTSIRSKQWVVLKPTAGNGKYHATWNIIPSNDPYCVMRLKPVHGKNKPVYVLGFHFTRQGITPFLCPEEQDRKNSTYQKGIELITIRENSELSCNVSFRLQGWPSKSLFSLSLDGESLKNLVCSHLFDVKEILKSKCEIHWETYALREVEFETQQSLKIVLKAGDGISKDNKTCKPHPTKSNTLLMHKDILKALKKPNKYDKMFISKHGACKMTSFNDAGSQTDFVVKK